tara:strand:- start:20247 stop:20753 length:507 start_codon:yes stop_codon:yes gene_type:complete
MFKFKIFEIPEGKSERKLQLKAGVLNLDEVKLKSGTIDIEFNRTLHFIQTKLTFDVIVELICDRSLDTFDFEVNQNYEILFKQEKIEESADENGSIRNIDIASQQIDIEQDVLDTILVSLPAKKLHPRFLDEDGNPIEFQTQQFGESDNDQEGENIDPRWDALKDLKK